MKKLFVLFFTFYTLANFAQTKSIKTSPILSEGDASSVGMSEERLARIDAMCLEAVEGSHIPGIVALVARNGKIVYYKAFGMADNEAGRVLKRDDIFRIASQSKAITSTAVMMLWEEGKFRLDNPITIRHLLTHTSGIGYGIIDKDLRFKKIYKDAGIMKSLYTCIVFHWNNRFIHHGKFKH